ncbi:MAG: hypothetical protein R3C52_08320 [Hyphomonadaceae bacterium]
MKRIVAAASLAVLAAACASTEPAAPPAPTIAALGHQGMDPAAGGAPQQLVVFFHGYTQSGEAMRPLATALAARLPNAAFVFDDAPLSAGNGHSWYNFRGDDSAATKKTAAENASKLVSDLANAYHIQPSNIVTVGFSQGGGVAVWGGTCLTNEVKAVVSLAGVVESACTKQGAAPAILVVHNDADPTVKTPMIEAGMKAMQSAGYAPSLKQVSGDKHWPAPDGIKAAEDFIVAQLGG